MLVIGLTGGVGMGKSTTASHFAALGAKICDADKIVHRLLAKDDEVKASIGKQFAGTLKKGVIDRKALGALVFADEKKRRALEAILHPKVVAEEEAFIDREGLKGAKVVVLEIPLLFETGAEARCDVVVVASAPAFLQKQRLFRRPGMTEVKFKGILDAQMPDREKRRRADAVVLTGLGKAYSFREVLSLMRELDAA